VDIEKGMHALLDEKVKRISIANPDHAPYGRAAVAALKSTGIYEAIKSKLIFGENVAQAAQFAESGNADAALLPLSLMSKMGGRHVEVPPDAYPRLEQ